MTMGVLGFVKIAVPFFAALAIGIFIASFFVDLSRPRFGGSWRARGWERHQMNMRLRAENEALRSENERLKNQIEGLTSSHSTAFDPTFDESQVPPTPPAPPVAIRHPREIRIIERHR